MENAFGQPQNVIVFGGSSDIAAALVVRLVTARTRTVVLAGRNQSALDAVATRASDAGATSCTTVLFDATDPGNAEATVAAAFAAVDGPVDLVVFAVGAMGDQLVDENDAAGAAAVAAVNFSWPVAALAAVRGRLVTQGAGRILVMTSIAAVRVRRGAYLYAGAKAGLDRLCEGVADSLLGTGVTLQVLRTGPVRTKMTAGQKDAPFTSDIDDVVNDIVSALGTTRRVITSPAILRYVFLVLSHVPASIWRKLDNQR